MIEAKHFLNGTQIYPVNGDDIGFKLDFTGEEGVTQGEINVDNIILATEAKKLVLDHINNGVGIFQGIPYQIQIENLTLEYYVDLTETPRISGDGDSTIEVKVKKRKSFDWFKTNADNLSFEALNKTHPISLTSTKYVIVRDNQGIIVLTSLMAAYSLAIAIAEQVRSLADAIGDLTAASTPDIVIPVPMILPGNGALVGNLGGPVVGTIVPNPSPTSKPAPLTWVIIKATLQTIFLLVTISAFISMMRQIVEIIYPRVREFKSSKVYELLNRGCEKLGFTFESSIITSSSPLTILPVPINDSDNTSVFLETLLPPIQPNYTKGYPTAIDTIPTLGALVDAVLTMFNGKIFVDNGVVKLERRDNWVLTSTNNVRNTLNLQDIRENEWTYNTGEAWKRYYLHYQVDFSDSHTTDQSSATKCEYSTEPTNILAPDLITIKGLADISIPFAFGIRKNELSPAEEFWKKICDLVDDVAGSFGATSNLSSKVKARIGIMQISQPQFSTTKLLYQIGSKQPSNYKNLLDANNLYIDYHKINEVDLNFKRIYAASVPFSSKDFEALQDNNYIYDLNGELLELLSFEWINNTKTAQIEYAVPATEQTNTTTIRIDV